MASLAYAHGWQGSVFCADAEINGWSGFRINYSK